MKRYLLFCFLLIFLVTVMMSDRRQIQAYSFFDKIRLSKAEKFVLKNPPNSLELETELKEWARMNISVERSLGYLIHREQIPEISFSTQSPMKRNMSTSGFIRDSYFGTKPRSINNKTWLRLTLAENGIFQIKEIDSMKTYQISTYARNKVAELQQKEAFTYWEYRGKKFFIQKVYAKTISFSDINFYENYYYEWYPGFVFDPHWIPIFSSRNRPTSSGYDVYLYNDWFLIEISFTNYNQTVSLQECQQKALSVLDSIRLYKKN